MEEAPVTLSGFQGGPPKKTYSVAARAGSRHTSVTAASHVVHEVKK